MSNTRPSDVALRGRLNGLGDPLPRALADYYTALDEGRFADAAAAFSPDTLYALPEYGAVETDARLLISGRDALRARFEGRGARPWVHDIELCVREGTSCLLEGTSRDVTTGETWATFMASAQLDEAGLVRRYLAYMCAPAVLPRPDAAIDGAPADAAAVLHDYFAALEAGRFEEAAACFSEDVLYSHPPYRHTGITGNDRVTFRGRAELVAGFHRRGRTSFEHGILACVQRGPHCIVEGNVEGLPEDRTGSFVSSLTLDRSGRIRRYVSFYCEPSVARA